MYFINDHILFCMPPKREQGPQQFDSRVDRQFLQATMMRKEWAKSIFDSANESVWNLAPGILEISPRMNNTQQIGFVLDLLQLSHPMVVVWERPGCPYCEQFLDLLEFDDGPNEERTTVFGFRKAMDSLVPPQLPIPIIILDSSAVQTGAYAPLNSYLPSGRKRTVKVEKHENGEPIPATVLLHGLFSHVLCPGGTVPCIMFYTHRGRWVQYNGERDADAFVHVLQKTIKYPSQNSPGKGRKRGTKQMKTSTNGHEDTPRSTENPLEKSTGKRKTVKDVNTMMQHDPLDTEDKASSTSETSSPQPNVEKKRKLRHKKNNEKHDTSEKSEDEKEDGSEHTGSRKPNIVRIKDTRKEFKDYNDKELARLTYDPQNCTLQFANTLARNQLTAVTEYAQRIYALAILYTRTHPCAVGEAVNNKLFSIVHDTTPSNKRKRIDSDSD